MLRRYDPYAREMTAEHYDQAGMRAARRAAVGAAAPAQQWGIVLGTLGRQARVLRHAQAAKLFYRVLPGLACTPNTQEKHLMCCL